MAGRPPIPIGQINRRIPEAGRIRTGEKVTARNGKERPAAIPDFIFTSAERNNVEAVAKVHGGEVLPFSDPKSPDRWKVRPGKTEVPVALPADPLGGTPLYEQYGGGGATHRCDGVLCTKYRKVDDAPEPYEVECECAAAGVLTCHVTTHLSVFLQGVRLTGVWRLTTKSYNAAQELPGMVEQIQTLQSAGIVRAVLGLKPRRQVLAGVTREFIVPVLGVDATIEELAEGHATIAALPAPLPEQPVAITSGNGNGAGPIHASDEDVVDAEIVGDPDDVGADGGEALGVGTQEVQPSSAPTDTGTDNEDLRALMAKRDLKAPPVNRMIRRLAAVMGVSEIPKVTTIGPSPLLDRLYAWIDGGGGPDDDPPDGGPGTPAPRPQGGEDAGAPVDAEVVDPGEAEDGTLPLSASDPKAYKARNRHCQGLVTKALEETGWDVDRDALRRTLAFAESGGRATSWSDLRLGEWATMENRLEAIVGGWYRLVEDAGAPWPDGFTIEHRGQDGKAAA